MPNRAFLKKYIEKFDDKIENENDMKELQLESVAELEVLKFSTDPHVRELFFQ